MKNSQKSHTQNGDGKMEESSEHSRAEQQKRH